MNDLKNMYSWCYGERNVRARCAGELGEDLLNPDMLRRPTMRREAQSTSALEGTFEPLETVLAQDYEVGEDKSGLSESMREVLNYLDAAECGIGQIQSGHPISLPLVRELQKLLVKGTKSDNPQACCQNIEESCEDALLRVKRLVNVRQRYRSLLDEHRYSGLSVQTAMYLIGQLTVTASMLRRRFGKSRRPYSTRCLVWCPWVILRAYPAGRGNLHIAPDIHKVLAAPLGAAIDVSAPLMCERGE